MFAYRMKPHFRHGKDTPWGGDALKRLYAKDIPDDHTGESLEASTLFDANTNTGESTALDGRTLTEVAGKKLPLLLKLIDANETLSVQVHPDDVYAMQHEHGKRGKTEAWLILHTKPGAKLVYGLTEGINIQDLNKENIEASLHWISVMPGDVLYIPAGMVHAIGAGIVLYEIQQDSDVTYRLWDWNRMQSDGTPRTLHFEKALDVIRSYDLNGPVRGTTTQCAGGNITHYLDTEMFTFKRLHVRDCMALPTQCHAGFAYLTALCAGKLTCHGQEVEFANGDTLFIPEHKQEIFICAQGDMLYASAPT